MDRKSFITLATGVNVKKKLFSTSVSKMPNKLECLFVLDKPHKTLPNICG
jgi:hypothetical protein